MANDSDYAAKLKNIFGAFAEIDEYKISCSQYDRIQAERLEKDRMAWLTYVYFSSPFAQTPMSHEI
jgi:hypothetical protein